MQRTNEKNAQFVYSFHFILFNLHIYCSAVKKINIFKTIHFSREIVMRVHIFGLYFVFKFPTKTGVSVYIESNTNYIANAEFIKRHEIERA